MRTRLMLAAALLGAGLLAHPRGGEAKIDLVTLPARDETQITVYSSEDLTLAREIRTVTFAAGENRVQFSWAGTLIDPTSPRLLFPGREDEFEILDITYPANTRDLLVWNVEAGGAGPVTIEIVYFISGLSWQADYVVKADAGETRAAIEGYVGVTNQSGEDFENTQTRLLVGAVNLVDRIADLARQGIIPAVVTLGRGDLFFAKDAIQEMDFAFSPSFSAFGAVAAAGGVAGRIKEVVKQALSEYQLYTIEGKEDLPNGWSKRLRSFSIDDARIEVAYEHNPEKYGPEVAKFYKLRNDAEHSLGKDPLPDGAWRVLRDDAGSGLLWEGLHTEKYVPVGEKLELNLGPDGLITLEDKAMEFRRDAIEFDTHKNITGYDEHTHWRIELRNSRPTSVPIKVTRFFDGVWDLSPKCDPAAVTYVKKDQRTVEFETTLAALSTLAIEYEVTIHHGTRADR